MRVRFPKRRWFMGVFGLARFLGALVVSLLISRGVVLAESSLPSKEKGTPPEPQKKSRFSNFFRNSFVAARKVLASFFSVRQSFSPAASLAAVAENAQGAMASNASTSPDVLTTGSTTTQIIYKPITIVQGVTASELDKKTTDIYQKLKSEITALVSNSVASETTTGLTPSDIDDRFAALQRQIGLSSYISRISDVTITSPTISNGAISNATISGGTISNASIDTLSVTVSASAPYYTASSNTSTSTFAGGLLLAQSGGRVGIGVADPQTMVDMTGTLRLRGATSGYTEIKSYDSPTSFTITLPTAAGVNGQVLSTDGTGALSWQNNGGGASTQWTTSGQNIYYNASAGKVGIGTTSPYSMFAVAGTVTGQNFVATSSNATSTLTNLSITGLVNLASTTVAGVGMIDYNGRRFISAFGTGNTFMGLSSGNATLSGKFNTGVGESALKSLTSGANNTALGYQAGANSNDAGNSLVGYQAGYTSSGAYNTISGFQAGYSNIGGQNTINGYQAGYSNTGPFNTLFGYQAGYSNTGNYNTISGYQAGYSNTGHYNNMSGYKAGNENTGNNNTISGYQAGRSNTGDDNIILGTNSGSLNTGDYNIFLGLYAGSVNTGGRNVFLGNYSGENNAGASNNTFLGSYTGSYNTTGSENTFSGYAAGYGYNGDATGSHNTFTGSRSGYYLSTGSHNTFTGDRAGYGYGSDVTGSRNTVSGSYSGYYLSSGRDNTFSGYQTGYYNTTGSYNSFFGNYAGYGNTEGSLNTFSGYQAGYNNTTGQYNTFSGAYSGLSNTESSYNSFYGVNSGRLNTEGSGNTFSGYSTGSSNTTGYGNTFYGAYSGTNNSTGDLNTFSGYRAGFNNTTGSQNIFIGNSSAFQNSTGSYNIFFGTKSGYNSSTGSYNTFSGYQSGYTNTGSHNSFSGYQSGYSNNGSYNLFSGYKSGYFNTTGTANLFSGYQSGFNNSTGATSTFIGYNAGSANTTGNFNTFIGPEAGNTGTTANLTNATAIGYNAQVTRSNSLILGGTGVNVGIGTTSPYSMLSVAGQVVARNYVATSTTATSTFAGGVTFATGGGNVGIGTTSPFGQFSIAQTANATTSGFVLSATDRDYRALYMSTDGMLHFAGGDGATLNDATLNAAGAWTNASDRSYKENIATLEYGLETLRLLSPRSYTMKGSGLKQIGFVAQELEQVVPEVVSGQEGAKGVSYGNLVSVVVKAVQDLDKRVEELATGIGANVSAGAGVISSSVGEWVGNTITVTVGMFKKLVVGSTDTPTAITIYDKEGKVGCVTVDNVATGVLKVTPGDCGQPIPASEPPASIPPSHVPTSELQNIPTISTPLITILGNNPAEVDVGATYLDLGATVTDDKDQNLGVRAFVDGVLIGEPSAIIIDTSTSTTHTIDYVVTDNDGNTATSTRTVVVAQPTPVQSLEIMPEATTTESVLDTSLPEENMSESSSSTDTSL